MKKYIFVFVLDRRIIILIRTMKYLMLLFPIVLLSFLFLGHTGFSVIQPSTHENLDSIQPSDTIIVDTILIMKKKDFIPFDGLRYAYIFDDINELHILEAEKNGIKPLDSRNDTALLSNGLVRIPLELNVYKVKKLTYSVPYLTPDAVTLLSDICINFRDSLINKKMPLYKPVVTSITRTEEDVKNLTRRNRNAVSKSAHSYGTTFDISWVSFEPVDPQKTKAVSHGRLKRVLGEVLSDLRIEGRCYVKYERRQPCFHITVR